MFVRPCVWPAWPALQCGIRRVSIALFAIRLDHAMIDTDLSRNEGDAPRDRFDNVRLGRHAARSGPAHDEGANT